MFDTTSTQTQSVASAAVAHTTTFWTHIFGPGPFNRFRVCRHFGSTVPFQRSWIWPVDACVFNVTKTALYIGLMQPSALVPHEPDLRRNIDPAKMFSLPLPQKPLPFLLPFLLSLWFAFRLYGEPMSVKLGHARWFSSGTQRITAVLT
jgi:hypothetical protein